MSIHNRHLASGTHRVVNAIFGVFVVAGLGAAGLGVFSPDSFVWSASLWLIYLSPAAGLALLFINPERLSLVRGLAGDAGYDELE